MFELIACLPGRSPAHSLDKVDSCFFHLASCPCSSDEENHSSRPLSELLLSAQVSFSPYVDAAAATSPVPRIFSRQEHVFLELFSLLFEVTFDIHSFPFASILLLDLGMV